MSYTVTEGEAAGELDADHPCISLSALLDLPGSVFSEF